MSLVICNDIKITEWRDFVDNHPAGNIFHTPEMYEVFDNTKGYKPEIWIMKNDDEILSFMMPVRITLFNRLLKRLTSRSVIHGSILCAENEKKEKALSLMIKEYVKKVGHSILFTELRNLDDLKTIQHILIQHHFEYEPHVNYLIDISREPEQIMQGIGKRTRKHIRRELRKGHVTVKDVKDRDGILECYKLLRKTFKAAKVPLSDVSLIESAFTHLFPKGMIKFTMATVNGQPAATSVDLMFKKVLYGWFGGMDRKYARYMPNEILTWNILKWGAENGFEIYDFGGAGNPNEEYGVRDFKAKFGGKLVCYGRNTYVHSPLALRYSKIAYKYLKPLISGRRFKN